MLSACGLPTEFVIPVNIHKKEISEKYTEYDFRKRLYVIEEYAKYKKRPDVLKAINTISEWSSKID